MRIFIEARSKELELDLSSDQVDRLNDMASGLFVWCATVFRYIESSKRSKKELIDSVLFSSLTTSKLEEGLFGLLYALYQRVLDSAVINDEDGSLMESILGTVFVASGHRPLSARAIADILYPDEVGEGKRVWVGNIIKSLSAIVYIEDKTHAIRAYHPSVLDFLAGKLRRGSPATSSTIEPFSNKLEEMHALVFEGCFAIMHRELRFNICELEDSFRLNKDVPDLLARITSHITEALRYGSLFWFSHLELSGVDVQEAPEQVCAFLESRKVLFWMEALSLMDTVERGIVILQDCTRLFTVRLHFLHHDNLQQLTKLRLTQA